MPAQELSYWGHRIHVDLRYTMLCYQVWLTDTHVLAAASLGEMFHVIDRYRLRIAA